MKRRADPVSEAEAWATAFHCRHDFFGDLAPMDDATVLALMPEVWARLGRIFLDRGMGAGFGGECYAIQQFGEPPCR